MNYQLTSPCDNCPFRTNIEAYITPARVRQIHGSLVHGEFPCHKTMDYAGADDESEPVESEKTQHCAGALIILEKLQEPSQMMRICERVNLYDASKLDMKAPVYDSFEDMEHAASVALDKRDRAVRKGKRKLARK